MRARPVPRWRSALALAAAMVSSGCGVLIGIDPWNPSGEGATTATGTGGLGGAGGSATGGGGVGGEDCVNGVDDDMKDGVDCMDPTCSAFACAALAPSGWKGPVLYSFGDAPATACPWPLVIVVDGGDGFDAPVATCAPCTCDSPVWAGCGAATLERYGGGDCVSNPQPAITIPSGSCAPGDGATAATFKVAAVAPSGGTCTPTGGGASVPPKSFLSHARLCGAKTGAGCAGGEGCFLGPAGDFQMRCIYAEGELTCPAGPYSVSSLIYGELADDRGCSACACSPAAGGACTGVVEVFSNEAACMGAASSTVNPGVPGCMLNGVKVDSARWQGAPGGGGCPASGGVPTGGVALAKPITVCCEP